MSYQDLEKKELIAHINRLKDELENSTKLLNEKIINAKDQTETLFRTVPCGIFTVDTNQTILSWNKEAEKITGL